MSGQTQKREPWLRGTLAEVEPVQRAVLHALEQAREDVTRWCGALTEDEVNARPGGAASVLFHLQHIARSLGRLLRYAEGEPLDAAQRAGLRNEGGEGAERAAAMTELNAALDAAELHVRGFRQKEFGAARFVGSERIPVTLGALLVHIAEHTMRHVGQAITTAQVVRGKGGQE